MGRAITVLVLAVVIGVTYSKACNESDRQPIAVHDEPIASAPSPVKPREVEPVFVTRGESSDGATAKQAGELELVAMKALYERCSKFYAWREGSTLRGEYHQYKGTFVTISVNIAHPEKANGNVLWYQVFFEGKNPVSVQATKTSAAELCGLLESNVRYDI